MAALDSNVDRIVANWTRRAARLAPRMRLATVEATKTILSESKRQMQRLIYDKPVPNRMQMQIERKRKRQAQGKTFRPRKNFAGRKENAAGRKPAWRRTRNLSRKERMVILSPYVGLIVNDASRKGKKGSRGYSKYRHNMKCRYPAPWRARAVELKRGEVTRIYREGMRAALAGR